MRFRFLLVFVGTLLVAATFTFPLWYPLLPRGGGEAQEFFPGLAAEQQPLFGVLAPELQQAYLARVETEENPGETLAMLTGALNPGEAAPASEQAMPELIGATIAASGVLGGADALREAEGDVTIYRAADNSWLVRLENFGVTNGPNLRVVLSAAPAPQTGDEVRTGDLDLDLGPLKGTRGNQHYPVPPEADLRQFRSLVIFSEGLDMIYARATLFIRSF